MREPPRNSSASKFRESRWPINGLSMNVASRGTGPPMVFLHGFPDHWRVWRPLMEMLDGAFWLLAPDLRGYNETTRPANVLAYKPEYLVADAVSLIRSVSQTPVCLVAHDWGATIAFWLAIQHPDLIRCMTILNGAHPYILQDAIWDDPLQREKSQYIETLRSETFEQRVRLDGGMSLAREWFERDLAKRKMSKVDFNAYLSAWQSPGAWTAMLNWYRAAPFSIPAPGSPAPTSRWTDGMDYEVKVPTQVIWGDQDPVFRSILIQKLKQHAELIEIHHLPHAAHVPQRDDPRACAALIRQFARRFL